MGGHASIFVGGAVCIYGSLYFPFSLTVNPKLTALAVVNLQPDIYVFLL